VPSGAVIPTRAGGASVHKRPLFIIYIYYGNYDMFLLNVKQKSPFFKNCLIFQCVFDKKISKII